MSSLLYSLTRWALSVCLVLLTAQPVLAQQRYDIAPIARNLYQVRMEIQAAFEVAERPAPTGPIKIRVKVNASGEVEKINFLTDLDKADQALIQPPVEKLQFLPARKDGQAVTGTTDITIHISVQLPDQADLPPPPERPDAIEIFDEDFFTETDVASDEDDAGNFSELLNSGITFPNLVADSSRNVASRLQFDQAPIFLNHYALEKEVRDHFTHSFRHRVSISLLVGADGYVDEFFLHTEDEVSESVAQVWTERFQFVPALHDDEPVSAWVICEFLLPIE